tara:strand:+ start:479 stop:1471 length:993 start_codon:yes stop_codon:yes gene_type:complete
MEKKLLVTGANGFLGSAITKLALKKGFEVNVLVRERSDLTNIKSISSKINFFYGDVRNIDSIKEAVKKSNIVFHVAADYRLWSKKPGEIYSTNVYGTENIASVVISENKKMIYTSSVATIGLNKKKVSDENVKSNFSDMHGDYKKSKFLAEQIILNLIKKKKLKAIIVNPSTPIGPGDIKPTPTGKIILDTIQKKMPAYVDTGLNFVHVDDVAEGHFLALKNGKIGEKYILGGENLSLKEFLDITSKIASVPRVNIKLNQKYLYFFAYINEVIAKYIYNFDPSLTVDGLRMSENKMFFSSDKAKKLLHYRPRNVKSAIKDAVEWAKKNLT